MKIFWAITKTSISLWLGVAFVLYVVINIDVSARLEYWASKDERPNMDPRIMYTFGLFGFVVGAFISGVIETLRQWVFNLQPLKWWQLFIVGATYPLIISDTALRNYIDYNTAETLSIILTVSINPFFAYWLFRGYSESKPA